MSCRNLVPVITAAACLSLAGAALAGNPKDDPDGATSPQQRSPYRWFMLVGFVAGGLYTARRNHPPAQRGDGDFR